MNKHIDIIGGQITDANLIAFLDCLGPDMRAALERVAPEDQAIAFLGKVVATPALIDDKHRHVPAIASTLIAMAMRAAVSIGLPPEKIGDIAFTFMATVHTGGAPDAERAAESLRNVGRGLLSMADDVVDDPGIAEGARLAFEQALASTNLADFKARLDELEDETGLAGATPAGNA